MERTFTDTAMMLNQMQMPLRRRKPTMEYHWMTNTSSSLKVTTPVLAHTVMFALSPLTDIFLSPQDEAFEQSDHLM
jgi:hypothetical protein